MVMTAVVTKTLPFVLVFGPWRTSTLSNAVQWSRFSFIAFPLPLVQRVIMFLMAGSWVEPHAVINRWAIISSILGAITGLLVIESPVEHVFTALWHALCATFVADDRFALPLYLITVGSMLAGIAKHQYLATADDVEHATDEADGDGGPSRSNCDDQQQQRKRAASAAKARSKNRAGEVLLITVLTVVVLALLVLVVAF